MKREQSNESRSTLLHNLFVFYAIISLSEGLLTIFWIVNKPLDQKTDLFLGFSQRRLFLLAVILGGVLIISAVLTAFLRREKVKEFIFHWIKKPAFGRGTGYSGMVLAIIALVPIIDWGQWGPNFEGALPLIIWSSLLFLQFSIILIIANGKFIPGFRDWVDKKINTPRRAILLSMIILSTCYLLSVLFYPSGVNEDYWYETGVPILLWQIISAIILGLIYIKFESQILRRLGRRIDISLFLIIFISCGLLWAVSPLTPSYFNPSPLPPNNVYYPYSDAAKFDLQAQSSLVGLGFDKGTPLDRPFYPLFLAIIHLFSGQNYSHNMMLQAFLYGVFPAIIYLVCAEMGARRWGVMTALGIGFWGNNFVLVNNVLNTSTQKQMLSDFPMVIVLSLVLYFSIQWLKGGTEERLYAFITGGMIALSAYVRTSAVLLLPLWTIIAIVKHRREFKNGLIMAALLITGFLAVTMPWYTRNIMVGKDIYFPFGQKVLFIIENRYQSNEKKINVEDFSLAYEGNIGIGSSQTRDIRNDEEAEEYEVKNPAGNDLGKPFFNWFTPHLVHNLMSSMLILPSSLEFSSLNTSLESGGEIWDQYWDGKLSLDRFFIILVQIFILTAGLISIFQRDKTTAVIIILLFFGLQLANSLGRTSGGRYIVPVNWVILLIYFAGILFLIDKMTFREESNCEIRARKVHIGWRIWINTILSMLIIGALPVIYERISLIAFPLPAEAQSFEEILALPEANFSLQEKFEMDQFLDIRKSRILQGFAFYPSQQLTNASINVSKQLGYDGPLRLLTFRLIQPENELKIVFPYGGLIDIQNQDMVFLVGCKNPNEVLVQFLVIIRQDSALYYQSDYMIDTCKLNN